MSPAYASHLRALAALVTTALACAPDLTVHASRITAPRVVAVRGTPAEARPGETVTLTATVATPAGVGNDAQIDWIACETPRATTESATVSPRCLDDAGALAMLTMERSTTVTVTVPSDACMRIGPQTPSVGQGAERVRSPDADITGGWQLPVRLDLAVGDAHETLFARYRVRCQPPDVPGATAVDYARRYRNNVNPALAGVFAVVDNDTRALARDAAAGSATEVGGPRDVPILALWNADSVERYVRVNPETRALDERTESLEIAWYTARGWFERDGTTPDGTGTVTVNVLHRDAGDGEVRVWVVLRDERGGVDVGAYRVR